MVKKHVGELGHTVNGKVYLQVKGRNISLDQTKAVYHRLARLFPGHQK